MTTNRARNHFCTTLLSTGAALGLLLAVSACDKGGGETEPPDDGGTQTDAGQTDGGGQDVAAPTLPPQDPDPAELAQAMKDYEQGNYEAVKTAMEGLLPSLEGDTKVRANIIANAWFAMAVAEEFPENAHDHVEASMRRVGELGDPEAEQLARIANGAYLIGVAEFQQAEQELAQAESLEGAGKEIARLLHAQSILNQAFDENDRITDPTKLEAAATSYQAVVDGTQSAIIKGRAEAGLAAIAKYQNKKDEICAHADAAAAAYEEGGASDYLKEVPPLLKKDGKCK